MNILPSVGKLAKLAITSYLAHLAKEEGVEKIHFLLVQYVVESYSISKNLENIAKLLANIQKKQLEFYLEELKDKNIYEVVDLSKRQKVIKNY